MLSALAVDARCVGVGCDFDVISEWAFRLGRRLFLFGLADLAAAAFLSLGHHQNVLSMGGAPFPAGGNVDRVEIVLRDHRADPWLRLSGREPKIGKTTKLYMGSKQISSNPDSEFLFESGKFQTVFWLQRKNQPTFIYVDNQLITASHPSFSMRCE